MDEAGDAVGEPPRLSVVDGTGPAEDVGTMWHVTLTVTGEPVPSHVVRYVAELVEATHPHDAAPDIVRRYARFGASPRGAQALILGAKATALLDGRPSVAAADVAAVAPSALQHRIGLSFEAAVDGVAARDVVSAVLDHVSAAPSV